MATRSGICLTCGTEENEKNISGVVKNTQNQESLETTLPFDLQESNRRKLETPVFGLEASPEYNQTEKNQENSEKSPLGYWSGLFLKSHNDSGQFKNCMKSVLVN